VTRHIRWQILLILLGILLVGILLTYLAVNYTTVIRPGRGGTYVEGIAGFPRYLNPLFSGYSEVDRDICALLFGGLTRLNEQGEVEPDLARAWDMSPDGLTYTFYLRSNAYWHDGVPVTAADVLFTIGLLQSPDFSGPADLGSSIWRAVTVEEVDQRTVRFVLNEPYAPFLDYTTVGLLPAHRLQGVQAADLPTLDFDPIGNGPFRVAESEIDEETGTVTSLLLERASRYYRARPYLERIQFRFYPSWRAVLNGYEAGEVEGVGRIPLAILERVSDLPSLNLFSTYTAEYGLVFLNLARSDLPFFQEAEVRQALMYALDRQRIIDEVLDGQALVAHSPFILGTWAYKENVQRYEYAPDQANGLLNSSGWIQLAADDGLRNKRGHRLAFTLLTSSEPERLGIAELLVEQWSTLGISVTIQTGSPPEIRQALISRDFEAILLNVDWAGDPDPYSFWHETQITDGQNYAGFVHRRASEVMEQARIAIRRDKRELLYDEFQDIFAQEMPALLLYVPVYTYGVDQRVHDVQVGPLMDPPDRFRTISDWWIVPRRVFVSEAEASLP
jgi:peptide/nickel transport system substrate-binding protein